MLISSITRSLITHITRGMLLCLMLVVAGQSAWACDTPVFIYALENWTTDPYEVFIFHRGPLSSGDRRLVDGLQAYAQRGPSPANMLVNPVDLSSAADESVQRLFDRQHATVLPWVAIYYPIRSNPVEAGDVCAIPEDEKRLFWSGPLRDLPIAALLDSPVRRTIARQLLRKDTIVWVLLESGNQGKDDATAQLLQTELAALQDSVTVSAPQVYLDEYGAPPKAHFPVVRLSRDVPQERLLVRMFLHSETGIADRKDPMVFPLYGRGIVLYALAGAGINPANLRDAVEFLVGPCSCEVKTANPGVELLIALDWDAYITVENMGDIPPPTGLAGFTATAETAKNTLATPAPTTANAPSTRAQHRVTPIKPVSSSVARAAAPSAAQRPVTAPAPSTTRTTAVKPTELPRAAKQHPLARNLIVLGLALLGGVWAATLIIKFQRRAGERNVS